MAIVFDSDAGTITGLSVGGLPDGTVDSDTLASGIDKTSISDSGDATAITIDSSERVGIGTGSPTRKVHIVDNSNYSLSVIKSGENIHMAQFASDGTASLGIAVDDNNNLVRLNSEGSNDSLQLEVADGTVGIKIDSTGAVTKPNQPAFEVAGSGGNWAANTVGQFDNETFDIGSNFNTSTYRFTAPIAGVYYFSWGTLSESANTSQYSRIRKNGSSVGPALERASTINRSHWSQTHIMVLAVNDYVDIYGGTSNNRLDSSDSFAGFLIG